MGKILVLAEKPSVARELARVLNCRQKKEGCIVGEKYIVTWALGHLVTLADPEFYGAQYKKWDMATLPMLPPKMELVVIKETSRQFNIVRELLKAKETGSLIIATDAGREGELVARWIIEKVGFKKPVQRLWISSQTDQAIREGFANLRPAKEYDRLYQAAVCRAEADWVVGLNVTRALTCRFNAQLTAGRVQTPTLAMIVAREQEISSFVAQEYNQLLALMPGFQMMWRDLKTKETRIFDPSQAEKLKTALTGADATITGLKPTVKKEPPPLLYDLTELQRDANRKFGFTAKQTLNIMQRLYEEHKLLTYPRTDSRYLSSDIVSSLKERLRAINFGGYAKAAGEIIRSGIKPSARLVNDAKVSDHHAIIPTEEPVHIDRLNADEKRIYDLVVKRFLTAFMPDYIYEQLTVTAKIKADEFFARGRTIKQKGWREIYDRQEFVEDDNEADKEAEQIFPSLAVGQVQKVSGLKIKPGKTKPPARYTEATLLSAMEHPNQEIKEHSLKKVLDQAGGIGTPATRADIIEKLFAAGYIERRGKEICPLSKGQQLIELVPSDLKSSLMTAEWEDQLGKISSGSGNSREFSEAMRRFASRLVNEVKASTASYRHDNLTRVRCPVCSKYMLETNTKKGKVLSCPDQECGYRQNLVLQSNARCPNCHKKLEITGEGEKRLYVCLCGFREKFDRFNQRLQENKNHLSKRETELYMKKQKEEPSGSSAFAEAWAKAMQQDKNQ